MRTNALIELLKICPRTDSELPYRVTPHGMSLANRKMILKISIPGGKNVPIKHTRFDTVYYLDGDEERAIQRFVEINREGILKMRESQCNSLCRSVRKELREKLYLAAGFGRDSPFGCCRRGGGD